MNRLGCFLFLLACGFAQAGESPYAGQQTRAIKALSPEDTHAYLQGAGMGLAKAAELNGYPGPMHTLELAEPLGLDSAQRAAVQRLLDEHKAEARALGKEVVERERALDELFAHRKATDRSVDEALAALAQAQARLRASHLKAHLVTTRLLTEAQVARYAELRGYIGTQAAAPAAGHHHKH